jgi:predicted O-methyltransferase YrrM
LRISSFFKYFFSAQNQHGLHSPFVFDLYRTVIEIDSKMPDFERIAAIRNEMRHCTDSINITDFGAGSKVNQATTRTVRDVVRNSEKSPRLARLLHRLCKHFEAATILDLGTSLGITTLYLATANPKSRILTFEGCPETAQLAQKNFGKYSPEIAQKIELIVGNIDHTLPQQVAASPPLDLVFFDANHRYEPTVRYFETCLSKAHENSLFIFDDIHWSDEMEQAWATIKAHPSVTISIDLYQVGLVFFRQKQPKQHFTLRFPFW